MAAGSLKMVLPMIHKIIAVVAMRRPLPSLNRKNIYNDYIVNLPRFAL
jgi:hypothetical protein